MDVKLCYVPYVEFPKIKYMGNNNNIIVTASKQTNLKENSGLPQSKCLVQVRDVSSFE